jgi:hypothetical protein
VNLKEVTFNTEQGILTLTFEDGTSAEFTDRAGLVAAYPEYERFADGMGWV